MIIATFFVVLPATAQDTDMQDPNRAAESHVRAFSDFSELPEGRAPGSKLDGQSLAVGKATWRADGEMRVEDTGSLAGSGTAVHTLPFAVGTYRMRVELRPEGVGSCAGIAFSRGNPRGNFFGCDLFLIMSATGGFEVHAKGEGRILLGRPVDIPDFRPDGFNTFEFVYNSLSQTLGVSINGKAFLADHPLPDGPDHLLYAALRFNDIAPGGEPLFRNYTTTVRPERNAGFEPADRAALFFDPGAKTTICFTVDSQVPDQPVPFRVVDYTEREMASGQAAPTAAGDIAIPLTLPRGFYELRFTESGERFGLVALTPAEEQASFFGMDAALGWLELDTGRRKALAEILKRSGIGAVRERLMLGHIYDGRKDQWNWEGGANGYEQLHRLYAEAGIPILEITQGSVWSQEQWTEIARHWGATWCGVEIDNEPDLRNVPADLYMTKVKSLGYAIDKGGFSGPIVGGVFATMPPSPYFDTCAQSGLVEISDAISFHSYDKTQDVEGMLSRYRTWLRQAGDEAKPLWHTECGYAWKKGPARPPYEEDAPSALEIAGKAIESRVCGVERFFPFVCVYYEEGSKNFGMMGRRCTPLRSMAAYAMAAKTIGNREYVGDLTGLDLRFVRARAFGGEAGEDSVAFLYTGKIDSEAMVPFPYPIRAAAGIDGRELRMRDGQLPVPDGICYVWLDEAVSQDALATDTPAMTLYETAKRTSKPRRAYSPIILDFDAKQTPSRPSSRQYLVTRDIAKALPVHVTAYNLAETPVTLRAEIQLPGGAPVRPQAATIPAGGKVPLAWTADASGNLDIASTRLIKILATDLTGGAASRPTPLCIPMGMEGTLEEHLARHSRTQPIPIGDLERWRRNMAEPGTSRFSNIDDGRGWRMDVSFGRGRGWVYPKFDLPWTIDPDAYSGLLMRARIKNPSVNVAIMANPNMAGAFWVSDLFPADGDWHVVYVPFEEFRPGPNQAGMQNARVTPSSWKVLAVGMSSGENVMEISHLMLVGGEEQTE